MITFEEEVAARREMVRATHPLFNHKEPIVTIIPNDQALASALEEKEDLEVRLKMVNATIKALRDC